MSKCCICGTEMDSVGWDDCPVCSWTNTGGEELVYAEDEIDDCNKISRAEAKRNFAKGLDIFGNPIKTK